MFQPVPWNIKWVQISTSDETRSRNSCDQHQHLPHIYLHGIVSGALGHVGHQFWAGTSVHESAPDDFPILGIVARNQSLAITHQWHRKSSFQLQTSYKKNIQINTFWGKKISICLSKRLEAELHGWRKLLRDLHMTSDLYRWFAVALYYSSAATMIPMTTTRTVMMTPVMYTQNKSCFIRELCELRTDKKKIS